MEREGCVYLANGLDGYLTRKCWSSVWIHFYPFSISIGFICLPYCIVNFRFACWFWCIWEFRNHIKFKYVNCFIVLGGKLSGLPSQKQTENYICGTTTCCFFITQVHLRVCIHHHLRLYLSMYLYNTLFKVVYIPPSSSPLQDIMNTPKFQVRKLQRQMIKERDYRDGLERELSSKLAIIAQKGNGCYTYIRNISVHTCCI